MFRYISFFSVLIVLLILGTSSCSKNDDNGDNSNLPTLSIMLLQVEEGNVDAPIYVSISLSSAAQEAVNVVVQTENGTATAGEDYQSLAAETITFSVGQTQKSVRIDLIGDEEIEADETFFLEIVSADNAIVNETQGMITIQNDDIDYSGDVVIPQTGFMSPESYPDMELIWSDEFDNGSDLEENWTFEIGNGNNGWGNNELQFYRRENANIQDNNLVITALKEPFGGRQYTSSRMITSGKFDFRYGRVDIRAVLPEGQGIWPALWMLGVPFWDISWPRCGEIDIMEIVGHERNKVHGTVHWAGPDNNHAEFGGFYNAPNGKLQNEFNVYSLEWDETAIRWYVNDQLFHTQTITVDHMSEFHHNYFFIFNIAVGGNWPGSPNADTSFPQHMIVDYIRVFQ